MNYRKEIQFGIVMSYINIIAQILIYAVFTPFAIRYMGDSQYGVYSLCTAIISTLGIIDAGLGSAYLKYYIEYRKDNANNRVEKLNGMFLTVFITLAAIAFFVGVLIAAYPERVLGNKLTSEELKLASSLLKLLSINLAVTFIGTVFTANVRANNKYFFLRGIDVFRTVIYPVLSIVALIMGYKAKLVVTISLVINCIAMLVYIYYCMNQLNMRFVFKDMQFRIMKKYFSFSIFVFLHTIMDQLNWQVDKYILARFCGSFAITVYSLGSQINMLFIRVSTAISDAFVPKIHEVVNNNFVGLTDLFIRVGRVQLMVVSFIFTGFVIFGQSFLFFWAGSEYTNSYYVAVFLMVPIVILLSQNLSIEILRAYEKHKAQAVVNIVIGVVNVIVSIPLCMEYGEIGCAVGTMITMGGIYFPFTNYYLAKHTNISLKKFYKSISKLLLVAIFALVIGSVLDSLRDEYSIKHFIIFIIGYTVVYWAMMIFIGFNKEEKEQGTVYLEKIKSFLRKRDGRV